MAVPACKVTPAWLAACLDLSCTCHAEGYEASQ